MFLEYPKALYLHGPQDLDAYVTVHGAAEEAEARQKGYRGLHEAAPEPVEAVAASEAGDDAPDAPKRRGRPPKALEAP